MFAQLPTVAQTAPIIEKTASILTPQNKGMQQQQVPNFLSSNSDYYALELPYKADYSGY